ncbi:MAG: dihydroorotase [Bacteroidota bacterium]
MAKVLIKNGLIINEGISTEGDILIQDERILRIDRDISDAEADVIDAQGQWVMPGIIDDQVHFREPGLTHKANIYSESRAALAGGVTTFMEMPNTKPTATTQELLQHKYDIAARSSAVNYSFYMGATNENLDEVLRTPADKVCGVKVFMGSSTGNMLVDDHQVLDGIFSKVNMLIATHCEDEETIRANRTKYANEPMSPSMHPVIRNREGCLKSSSLAVNLAKEHGTRLHVLHISTADEIALFDAGPVATKHITAEACVHHLYFDDSYYESLGNQVVCNPAIKTSQDRKAIFQAVLDDRIDVIATDHAPHTQEEKANPYPAAPSGLPLIQHTLVLMLSHYHDLRITKEKIVEKMCHAPADLFRVIDRGYLREGYFADIVLVDPDREVRIRNQDVHYRCGWTPLDGMMMKGHIDKVFVNGELSYDQGMICETCVGKRLTFRI